MFTSLSILKLTSLYIYRQQLSGWPYAEASFSSMADMVNPKNLMTVHYRPHQDYWQYVAPVLLVVLLVLVLAVVDDRVNVLAASILLMACFVCAINKCLISSVSISAVIRCFKQGSTRVPVKAKDQECHISDGLFSI